MLSQGLRVPNYIYEPMAYFNGKNISEQQLATAFRAELKRVFATGQPKESSFQAGRSTRGIDIKHGGDVITKTVRLRYRHLRGWIEDLKNIKVNA